jgi:hypothetical protein
VLLQTLIIGLLQPPAKSIRYHWLEFVTASLPHMGDELGDVVVPVLRCMCELLDSYQSAYDSLSSRDILMLLHALAVILDHCSVRRRRASRRKRKAGLRRRCQCACWAISSRMCLAASQWQQQRRGAVAWRAASGAAALRTSARRRRLRASSV